MSIEAIIQKHQGLLETEIQKRTAKPVYWATKKLPLAAQLALAKFELKLEYGTKTRTTEKGSSVSEWVEVLTIYDTKEKKRFASIDVKSGFITKYSL